MAPARELAASRIANGTRSPSLLTGSGAIARYASGMVTTIEHENANDPGADAANERARPLETAA